MMRDTVKDTVKAVRDGGAEEILSALGLERRRGTWGYVLPAVGYFAAGLAVGTGITLLVAPKTGRQMRREIGARARDLRDQVGTAAERVTNEVQGRLMGGDDHPDDEGLPMKRAAGSGASSSPNAKK